MADRTTLRSSAGTNFCWIVWGVCALSMPSFVILNNWRGLAQYAPLLALVSFAAWVILWAPRVEIRPDALAIVNILRTWRVPWSEVRGLGLGGLLAIHTSGRTIKAIGIARSVGSAMSSAADTAQTFQLNMFRATPDDSIGSSARDARSESAFTGTQNPSVVAARQIARMHEIRGRDAHGTVTVRWHWAQFVVLFLLAVVFAVAQIVL